ncbi:MAG: cation transporter [Patescibacteria group bacterium]
MNISAKRVVWTSFFVDLLDILVNVFVALLTGSIVMVAELFQGVFDLIASGLLIVGLKRSKKEAYFWTLLSALVMLILASTLSFYFGLKRFLDPTPVEYIFLAYGALVISVVSNGYAFWLSAKRILKDRSIKQVFRAFWGSSLYMTKNTFVLDLMGMSAAFVGLIALVLYQVFGEVRFDGLGAMGIGTVLAFLSLNLVLDIWRMGKREVRLEEQEV